MNVEKQNPKHNQKFHFDHREELKALLQQWAVVFTGGSGLTTEGILNHLNAYVEKVEASALNCVNM